jgi:hypothetical protein
MLVKAFLICQFGVNLLFQLKVITIVIINQITMVQFWYLTLKHTISLNYF